MTDANPLPNEVRNNPNDPFYIINANGRCLHLHAAEDRDGAPVTLWSKVDQDNLKWYVRPTSAEGYYHLVSEATGRVAHNNGGGSADGAPVTTWQIVEQDNLKVRFEPVGDEQPGYYYIAFKDFSKCIRNNGDVNADGNPISQAEKQAQPEFWWRFESSELPVRGLGNEGSQVAITHILYDGATKRTEADEYVEVSNQGSSPADVSGWTLDAEDRGQTFSFPAGTTLQAGQSVRVYTNQVHPETGGFSFGSKTAIWNNAGESGVLTDAEGEVVSRYSYGGKAESGGTSTNASFREPWSTVAAFLGPFAFMIRGAASEGEIKAWETENGLQLGADVRAVITQACCVELPNPTTQPNHSAETTLLPLSDWKRFDRSAWGEDWDDPIPNAQVEDIVLIGEDPLGADYGYLVLLHVPDGKVYGVVGNTTRVKPMGTLSEWIAGVRLPKVESGAAYPAAFDATWQEIEGTDGSAEILGREYVSRLQSKTREQRWKDVFDQFKAVYESL